MVSFLDIRKHPEKGNEAGYLSPQELAAKKESERRHIYLSIAFPLLFVAVIWIVKMTEVLLGLDFSSFGVFPRKLEGLLGVLTSPLIHQDYKHTLSNSAPFFVLGFLLYNAYRKVAFRVFVTIWLVEGLLVWLIGRPAFHIGASGVVYGFAFFLFFSGVFRLDIRSMALSLLVAFVYGSMVYGVLPLDLKVSWEAHLMGALVGSALAWYYREVDRAPEFTWDDEEESEESNQEPSQPIAYRPQSRLEVPPASFQRSSPKIIYTMRKPASNSDHET